MLTEVGKNLAAWSYAPWAISIIISCPFTASLFPPETSLAARLAFLIMNLHTLQQTHPLSLVHSTTRPLTLATDTAWAVKTTLYILRIPTACCWPNPRNFLLNYKLFILQSVLYNISPEWQPSRQAVRHSVTQSPTPWLLSWVPPHHMTNINRALYFAGQFWLTFHAGSIRNKLNSRRGL